MNGKLGVKLCLLAVVVGATVSIAAAAALEDDLGRNETRVRSAAYPLTTGRTVQEIALPERLDRLGYRRVREKPDEAGEFFYGYETFWIFRRAHRLRGREYRDELSGLKLRRKDGLIVGAVDAQGEPRDLRERLLWLEPETLSESLAADRADRILITLDDLPGHVWQSVLAAEDARFFDHAGVDVRSVARAALANMKSGGVEQGGSTITQQLIKNRDLTPKRTLGRKTSEAVRALWLEAEYDKHEILEAYLNQLYLGNVEGLAIHGIGAASRVYFSKPVEDLSLAEAATLAAMVQGPNRLSPLRHPRRVRERRDWVLSRLDELEWIDSSAIAKAKKTEVRTRTSPPQRSAPAHFLTLASFEVEREAPKRMEEDRGVVVETTLDPYLQMVAERSVASRLDRLRRDHRRLRDAQLSAALVAVDARTGEILAYVGGDPADPDGFDRARRAKRQPGSAVKPFILLEAFSDCGERLPLYPASRVADRPLTMKLPSGEWSPDNYDGDYLGIVTARQALADSRNVPMVRIARWCGFDSTARTFERAGLDLPADPPPSFVLGSVEVTPLEMAGAYTVMAGEGRAAKPFGVKRVEKPEGRGLGRNKPKRRRVVSPATAWLVQHVMRTAVREGTATIAGIDGLTVAAKTGTSSELRDAWFAGHAGSLVTVVWVGLDDGKPLGLTGAAAAGPIWKAFMAGAAPARPPLAHNAPQGIIKAYVDPETGLRVGERNRRAYEEVYRRGATPRRDRFWRRDKAVPVVE
jgi:1A family penicillin-binding protein